LSLGGVVGPATFVATWAVLGATSPGYDPTRQAISRLAAVGASSRPAMTAGLVVLSAGMGLYAAALRPSRTWILAAANSATTLGVAALPLGSRYDDAHGAVAALSYLTLAAVPLAAAPGLPGRALRAGALAAGAVSGLCLVGTALVDRVGLLQRLGLTVAQLWVVLSALRLASGPRWSSMPRPGRGPAPLRP
jgi:hypothetical membrane protein